MEVGKSRKKSSELVVGQLWVSRRESFACALASFLFGERKSEGFPHKPKLQAEGKKPSKLD